MKAQLHRFSASIIIVLFSFSASFGQTYSAFSTAKSANDQTLFVSVNPSANKVTMVITGNDSRYFAFGFNATNMAAQPYCIYTNTTTALERKLGNHSAGSQLTPTITVKSNTTDSGVRTIVLERTATGLNSNYYDFSSVNGSTVLNYIWAHGSSHSFNYHGSNRGSNALSFSQDSYDTGTLNVTACGSYTAPSCKVYTTSGSYQDTLITVVGNDSIYTINLTINNNTSETIAVTECESYIVPSGNQTLTASGTYMDTIPNNNNCDSIITINLTINNTDTTFATVACDSLISPSGNFTWTTSGTFMDTIANSKNCDSIITVNLTIGTNDTTYAAAACDSLISPSGNFTWTTSGTFMDTVLNSNNCDSVITVNLTIGNAASTISVTECDSLISPSGNYIYTSSGTFMDTVPSTSSNCDSIITINLTIVNIDTSIVHGGVDLTSNQNGATYQWLDCDNNLAPISGETNQNFAPTANGNYAVAVTVNGCTDTSDCHPITAIGIDEWQAQNYISVFPNPTNGKISIVLKNSEDVIEQISIKDITGKTIFISRSNKIELSSYSNGIYFVEVKTLLQQQTFKLIKR